MSTQSVKLSPLEQLQQLKALTVRTDMIHEAQAIQLRNYPRMIEGIRKATTKVDTDSKTVYFECEPEKKRFKLTPVRADMCASIVKWVQTILWDNTIVVVNVNGKTVYDSRDAK